MTPLLFLVPSEFLVLLIAAGGLAMIFGARGLAMSLLGTAAAIAFLPVLLAPLFNTLPAMLLWALIIIGSVMLLGGVLRWLFESVIGRRSTDDMIGILAADVVRATAKGLIALPIWLVGVAWRLLRRLAGP